MLKNKKILFDFDGTLNHSFKRHYILHKEICKILNINENISFLNFVNFKKKGISNLNLINTSSKLKKVYNQIWLKKIETKRYLFKDNLITGVKKNINKLYKFNDLMINTHRKSKNNFLWQLRNYDILKYFKKIYFISNLKYKSKKEFFKKKKLNNLIVVGDTFNDIDIINCRHTKYYSLLTGYTSENRLKKKNTKIIKTLDELLNL